MVFSNSWHDQLSQLRTVLNLMKEAGLTVKVGNCQFGTSKCVYLGHMVGNGSVEPELSRLQAACESFPLPSGMFYSGIIKSPVIDYSGIDNPPLE